MTRQDKQIVIAVGLASLAFLATWLCGVGSLSDFGLNGFTETLGIAFTVFLIDRLLSRREAARTLPQRLAAFEDARLLAQRRISFWFQAYMLSVPDPLPASVQELFSRESIARVGSLLDMDSQANVTPQRTWWRYATEDLQSFHVAAERLLERYNSILEPTAFLAVHRMLNSAGEPGLVHGLLQSDKEMGTPRPKVLGNFVLTRPDFFAALLELIDWLMAEKNRLEKETGRAVGIISTALQGNRASGVPACMIAPDKLANQLHAWQQAQQDASGGSQYAPR